MGLKFQYHPDIVARYPSVSGGIILARGMRNSTSPDELRELYISEQKAVLARIGDIPLSELESLAAWRAAFRMFGVDPTQYRSAAEALLRRLTKKGDIPSINLLVDIGNLVSIRYGLPIAMVDVKSLQGTITVHFSDGTEPFTPLGETTIEHPEIGEVIFTDENKLVIARRWCWRQSDESAARESTTDAIVTIEAHNTNGLADVQSALNDIRDLLTKFSGGAFTSGILGAHQLSVQEE